MERERTSKYHWWGYKIREEDELFFVAPEHRSSPAVADPTPTLPCLSIL